MNWSKKWFESAKLAYRACVQGLKISQIPEIFSDEETGVFGV